MPVQCQLVWFWLLTCLRSSEWREYCWQSWVGENLQCFWCIIDTLKIFKWMNGAPFSNAGSWDLKSRFSWNWGILVRMLSAAGKDKTDSGLLSNCQVPSFLYLALLPSWLCSLLILHCVVSRWLPISRLHLQTQYPTAENGIASCEFHFPGRETFPRGLVADFPPCFLGQSFIAAHA